MKCDNNWFKIKIAQPWCHQWKFTAIDVAMAEQVLTWIHFMDHLHEQKQTMISNDGSQAKVHAWLLVFTCQ